MAEAHVCKQLAKGCYLQAKWRRVQRTTLRIMKSNVIAINQQATRVRRGIDKSLHRQLTNCQLVNTKKTVCTYRVRQKMLHFLIVCCWRAVASCRQQIWRQCIRPFSQWTFSFWNSILKVTWLMQNTQHVLFGKIHFRNTGPCANCTQFRHISCILK